MIKTVVHLPSGEFKNKQGQSECGPFEPSLPALSVVNGVTTYDPDYAIVVVPRMPDPRIEKWNGSAIVAKTQGVIDAYDAAKLADHSTRKSLDPDILAMLATIVRGRLGGPAWNALTTMQKKQVIRDEAAIFKGMREFFDKGA